MRILIATGGAPHSEIAVRQGIFVAQMTGAHVVILNVIPHLKERPKADQVLERARALMDPRVDGVQTLIRVGYPVEEILAEVARHRYDLLVLGERSPHKLVRRIFGPTTERIISQMPCPVLISRKEARPLNRWLLCEGGRDPSLFKRLSDRLLVLMRHASEITVLHVMSQISAAPGVPGWELRADADELIAKHTPEGELLFSDVRSLESLNIQARAKIRHGLVVDEILTEAQSGNYDLLVIGAHESKGWQRFLLDNLARQIVLQANRPILIL